MSRILISATACLLLFACDDAKKEAPAKEKPVVLEQAKAAAEKKAKEVKAAAAKAAKEKAQTEKAKAQAAVDANPLTECCRALGKHGFTKRSPTYMAASKVCGAAMAEKKSKADVLPAIKKELKNDKLPKVCE